MIVIIDYGMGNIASVKNALEHLKLNCVVSRDAEVIMNADKLILPGVGSFKKAMGYLNQYGLVEVLNEKVINRKTPVLGICLGMQLLAEFGTEDAEESHPTPGLKWISGKVTKIQTMSPEYRVPHMGFNSIRQINENQILRQIPIDSHFYFVHSYHFQTDQENIIAVTEYESELVAIVGRNNIVGVQFHPEKSQQVGLKLIQNFVGMM
ncbi:MAG: imidazole glycerol phosphate synthase subunit HisH [Bacteriovoracaceae bacterium]|nr:imidazole glycerol phosphate synthase subunit HisH [Bacteriovoracaceae bacterium]